MASGKEKEDAPAQVCFSDPRPCIILSELKGGEIVFGMHGIDQVACL